MNFSWDRFHSESRHVSNASIICEDGVIFTHKLVLATLSKLLEQMMSDVPAADEVTIYLKTFEKSTVEEFFDDLLLKGDCSHYELCSIFGVETSPEKGQGSSGPRRLPPELGVRAEEPPTSSIKTMIGNDEQKNKAVVKIEDEIDDSESVDLESNESFEEEKQKRIQEHMDKVTDEKVGEFEKELIKNPKTKSDFIQNRKVDKKIRYEKAIAFYKSGQAQSVHHAAKMFGLHPQTLMKFILTGGSFQGGGKYLSRFSKEEEKVIVDRVLKLSGENALTFKLLQEIILEEADAIKINQPERSDKMLFTSTSINAFSHALADRNGIKDLVNSLIRKDQESRRNYECEICQRSFTYQNSLVKHRKITHSFLYC